MTNQNLISVEITDEDIKFVNDAMDSIIARFTFLLTLSKAERREMPQMRDGNLPFVLKSLDYVKTKPSLAPPYMEVEEFEKDVMAASDLLNMMRLIDHVRTRLEDTMMVAGGEAFAAALAYYNYIKGAAKAGVPGAKPIYEDLRVRFRRGPVKGKNDNGQAEGQL